MPWTCIKSEFQWNLGVGSKKNEGKFTFTVNENLHSLQCTGSLISSNENRRICDERKIPNQEKKECKFKKLLYTKTKT